MPNKKILPTGNLNLFHADCNLSSSQALTQIFSPPPSQKYERTPLLILRNIERGHGVIGIVPRVTWDLGRGQFSDGVIADRMIDVL